MKLADRRGCHHTLAKGIQQGVYGSPPRAMAGHNHLQAERFHILDRFGDNLLTDCTRQMETAHDTVKGYRLKQCPCMFQYVYDSRVGAGLVQAP